MTSRRQALATGGGFIALASARAFAQSLERTADMAIRRSGSQPSGRGPAQYFTGNVRVDPMFPASPPSRVSGGHVTFEPGARSNWHTHPLGQTLWSRLGSARRRTD
jgi:hypothetical protein